MQVVLFVLQCNVYEFIEKQQLVNDLSFKGYKLIGPYELYTGVQCTWLGFFLVVGRQLRRMIS